MKPGARVDNEISVKMPQDRDVIDDQYTLHYTDNALLRAIYHHPFELNDGQGV